MLKIIPETNKIPVFSGVHHERDAYIFFLTRLLPRFRKTDQSKTWRGSNNLRFDTAQILRDLAQTLNRKIWFIFWNCPYKINICSRKVRTHSPAIRPCPYHSCLCTHRITIHTTQVTDRAYACTRGTCLGANITQVAGGWMMAAGGKADRKAVCELGELPRCLRTASALHSGKSENQGTNEEKENPEKEETLVTVTASAKGPSSPFAKPRRRLWSMGWRKCPLPAHCWEEMTALENPVDGERSESGALKSKTRGPSVLWSLLYLSVWDTVLRLGDGAMKEPTWLNPSEAHGVCVGCGQAAEGGVINKPTWQWDPPDWLVVSSCSLRLEITGLPHGGNFDRIWMFSEVGHGNCRVWYFAVNINY